MNRLIRRPFGPGWNVLSRAVRAAAFVVPFVAAALGTAWSADPPRRLVTVTPVATDIVLSLGARQMIVGVDQTSVVTPDSTAPPRVGYQRALSAEGILALRPTLVIGTEDAGPPPVLDALRRAGVKVEILPAAATVDAARQRIRRVGDLLGLRNAARRLVADLDRDVEAAVARRGAVGAETRVLFVYTRGNTSALVSGAGTPADAVIGMAGARNAMGDFTGYRPLGAEAIAAAAPDVILAPKSAAQALGGVEVILALPGMSLTPAGRTRRVVVLEDDRILHFGPGFGKALGSLVDALAAGTPK